MSDNTSQIAQNALSAGVGGFTAGSAATPIVGLITGLAAAGISAWATYQGGKDQQAANDVANASSRSAANMENAYNEAEQAKEWSWRSEDRDYQRGVKMAADIIDKLNQSPAQHSSLINLWAR